VEITEGTLCFVDVWVGLQNPHSQDPGGGGVGGGGGGRRRNKALSILFGCFLPAYFGGRRDLPWEN